MRRHLMLLVSLLVVMAMTGCASNTESGTYVNLSVKEAYELIKDPSVQVIDVRTPEEYAAGHIPNAALLPLQEIDTWHSTLETDTTYLIVCRSGNRSAQASEYLADKGFTGIHNMTGGMNEWSYAIEK